MLLTLRSARLKSASSLFRFVKSFVRMRESSTLRRDEQTNEEAENEEEPLVIIETFETLTIIGLNRPSKRNALNKNLIIELDQAITDYENNSDAHVAVLHGIGGNFCAGLDLEEISRSDKFERPVLPLVDRFCSKPIIASINGYAVGEGLDLALACDMRVMEETAVLGVFNRRFGLPMSEGSISRIVNIIGFSRAIELILSGRPVRAKEALPIGLANEIIPCGSGRGRALILARSLIKFPQACLRSDRATMYKNFGPSESMQKMADIEAVNQLKCALQENIPKRVSRFKEGIGKHGSFKNLTDFGGNDWIPE